MRHTVRPALSHRTPVHVTVKLRRGLPSLRQQLVIRRVRMVLRRASSANFRVVHWSAQNDHLHLIAEAMSARELSRGMAVLNAALARQLNGLAAVRGRALRERYHVHQLRTPREVHHAIGYVLNNARKHGHVVNGVDAMSSAPFFSGIARGDATVREPQTWLLRIGWQRYGAIVLDGG